MAEIIRIEGLHDLQLMIGGLPTYLKKKVMYKLLRKAAAPILKAAKANAPVGDKYRVGHTQKGPSRYLQKNVIPGLIRDTLKISTSRYWKPANGEFGIYIKPKVPGIVKKARKHLNGMNFGDPYYYRFQEEGFHTVGRSKVTGSFGRKKGPSQRARRNSQYADGKHRFIPGKRFIGRAFDSQKQAALNLIKVDLVAEIIEQFNRKGQGNGNSSFNR